MERNDSHAEAFDERRIVVGVDGSACATRAVKYAVVSAYQEMPAQAGMMVPLSLFQESAEAIVAEALRQAEELEPSVVVKGEAVLDAPGRALARLSKGASALVVGTRGHNELTGLFLGSVSEYVLHHATCTTIVVR